jgi:hypothetical protein
VQVTGAADQKLAANSACHFPGVQKCPLPASKPARVLRSATATSRPWSPNPHYTKKPLIYGFIPPSKATSSAKQLIAAACSANLRHVCAILIRTVLSEALEEPLANRRHSMAFCR